MYLSYMIRNRSQKFWDIYQGYLLTFEQGGLSFLFLGRAICQILSGDPGCTVQVCHSSLVVVQSGLIINERRMNCIIMRRGKGGSHFLLLYQDDNYYFCSLAVQVLHMKILPHSYNVQWGLRSTSNFGDFTKGWCKDRSIWHNFLVQSLSWYYFVASITNKKIGWFTERVYQSLFITRTT